MKAVEAIIRHANKGYETPYKREVGGHLFGYREGRGFYVGRAVPYNTPLSSRTSWCVNPNSFARKGLRLETGRLKWIGAYHSHVEIRGTASTGQSREDRIAQIFSDHPVEIIVRVTNYRMNTPKVCLSFVVGQDGYLYYFDICGYVKDATGRIRRVGVEAATE